VRNRLPARDRQRKRTAHSLDATEKRQIGRTVEAVHHLVNFRVLRKRDRDNRNCSESFQHQCQRFTPYCQ
jgi:hypothetical protein